MEWQLSQACEWAAGTLGTVSAAAGDYVQVTRLSSNKSILTIKLPSIGDYTDKALSVAFFTKPPPSTPPQAMAGKAVKTPE